MLVLVTVGRPGGPTATTIACIAAITSEFCARQVPLEFAVPLSYHSSCHRQSPVTCGTPSPVFWVFPTGYICSCPKRILGGRERLPSPRLPGSESFSPPVTRGSQCPGLQTAPCHSLCPPEVASGESGSGSWQSEGSQSL